MDVQTAIKIPTCWRNLDRGKSDMWGKRQLMRSGFSDMAAGFGTDAHVRFFQGEPIVAFHWFDSALDGFSIARKFRKQGVGTALLRELIDDEGGKLLVCFPNKRLMRILQRLGEVSEEDGESCRTVTRRLEKMISA